MILDNSSPCNSVLFTSYLWYRKFFKNWLPVLWLHYRPFDFNWGENMWCLFHMLKWKNTLFRNILDYSVEFLVVFFFCRLLFKEKKRWIWFPCSSPPTVLSALTDALVTCIVWLKNQFLDQYLSSVHHFVGGNKKQSQVLLSYVHVVFVMQCVIAQLLEFHLSIYIYIKMEITWIVVNTTVNAFTTSIKFLHIPAPFWLGNKLSIVL